MDDGKYIIIDINGSDVPILFPSFIEHITMRNKFSNCDIISAGMFSVGVDKDNEISVSAYGKSVSLNVESRKEDVRIIKRIITGVTW